MITSRANAFASQAFGATNALISVPTISMASTVAIFALALTELLAIKQTEDATALQDGRQSTAVSGNAPKTSSGQVARILVNAMWKIPSRVTPTMANVIASQVTAAQPAAVRARF